jgi:hypothetical protein
MAICPFTGLFLVAIHNLLAAVQHYCACSFDRLGGCSSICPGHLMLVNDQRALDSLLWHRHLRYLLLAQEGLGPR